MERLERERRKEEERLMREKQREEEKSQREQRREMERREKFLQKEYLRVSLRTCFVDNVVTLIINDANSLSPFQSLVLGFTLQAEKKRQKEELRKEREEERRRVAREKATARKIAKESMDLLEDEQLELMELAAASKGIPSIIHLDHNSLQNLESFRGKCHLKFVFVQLP